MQAAGTEEDPVDLVSDDSSDEVPPPAPAAVVQAPATTSPRKSVLLHGGLAAKRQHSNGTRAAAADAARLKFEAPEAEPAAEPAPAAGDNSPRLVEVAKMLKVRYADSIHVVHAMAPFCFLAEQLYGDDVAWGEVRLGALVCQLPSLPERARGSCSGRLVQHVDSLLTVLPLPELARAFSSQQQLERVMQQLAAAGRENIAGEAAAPAGGAGAPGGAAAAAAAAAPQHHRHQHDQQQHHHQQQQQQPAAAAAVRSTFSVSLCARRGTSSCR